MRNVSIAILAGCALQTACIIDGSPGGEPATRTSQPADFERLLVTGGFDHVDVRVCGDCAPLVKVTGDDRHVDDVIINVSNSTLELRHRSQLVVTNIDLRVVLHVPDLVRLDQTGSADVSVRGIATERFHVVASGSGNIELEGIVAQLDATSDGSGDVTAYDLQASDVDVTLTGSGDARVCAASTLRAQTAGSGDVFYDCNPETTDFDATGSGRISIR